MFLLPSSTMYLQVDIVCFEAISACSAMLFLDTLYTQKKIFRISLIVVAVLAAFVALIYRYGLGVRVVRSRYPRSKLKDDFGYSIWAKLLRKYVSSKSGKVNFAALLRKRERLDEFIAMLAVFGPESTPSLFPESCDQIAYYINAYNALVLFAILEYWPIASVLDIRTGFCCYSNTAAKAVMEASNGGVHGTPKSKTSQSSKSSHSKSSKSRKRRKSSAATPTVATIDEQSEKIKKKHKHKHKRKKESNSSSGSCNDQEDKCEKCIKRSNHDKNNCECDRCEDATAGMGTVSPSLSSNRSGSNGAEGDTSPPPKITEGAGISTSTSTTTSPSSFPSTASNRYSAGAAVAVSKVKGEDKKHVPTKGVCSSCGAAIADAVKAKHHRKRSKSKSKHRKKAKHASKKGVSVEMIDDIDKDKDGKRKKRHHKKKKRKSSDKSRKVDMSESRRRARRSYWFFEALRFEVDGNLYSLWEIEHEILKDRFKDPRVFAALSKGCIGSPRLSNQAYNGKLLDDQLNVANRSVCSGRRAKDLTIKEKSKIICLSTVFKQFKAEYITFAQKNGWIIQKSDRHHSIDNKIGTLLGYAYHFADKEMREKLQSPITNGYKVRYIEFDWSLSEHKSSSDKDKHRHSRHHRHKSNRKHRSSRKSSDTTTAGNGTTTH